jgi:hypothetical protein
MYYVLTTVWWLQNQMGEDLNTHFIMKLNDVEVKENVRLKSEMGLWI